MALVPCLSCSRHVRARERACQFCAAPLGAAPPPRALPTARLGRAATFAFGAGLAGAAGCSASHAPEPDASARADAPIVAEDGPGGPDAGPSSSDAGPTRVDAGLDAGAIAPPYGLPPEDGGPPPDGGGPMNLYGAPPAP